MQCLKLHPTAAEGLSSTDGCSPNVDVVVWGPVYRAGRSSLAGRRAQANERVWLPRFTVAAGTCNRLTSCKMCFQQRKIARLEHVCAGWQLFDHLCGLCGALQTENPLFFAAVGLLTSACLTRAKVTWCIMQFGTTAHSLAPINMIAPLELVYAHAILVAHLAGRSLLLYSMRGACMHMIR